MSVPPMAMFMDSRPRAGRSAGRGRGVVTSGGGFTDLVDKVLYAVTAVLVVCSLSFAAQRTFFEPVATVDDRRAQATLPATAREAARSAISAGQNGKEEGAGGSRELAPRRGTGPPEPPAPGRGG